MLEVDGGFLIEQIQKPQVVGPITVDPKIEKKIKRLLKKIEYNRHSTFRKIEKEFKDINYIDENGNTLAHLFITSDGDPTKIYYAIDVIFTFSKFDQDQTNNNGQNVLQTLITTKKNSLDLLYDYYYPNIKCNPNSIDKYGNTLLHNCAIYSDDFSGIEDIYTLLRARRFDSMIKNKYGQTFFDILEDKYYNIIQKGEEDNLECDISYFENIKMTYLYCNPQALFERFNDDKKSNTELILDVYSYIKCDPPFIENLSLLFDCLSLEENYNTIQTVKRLLECGCDPNLLIKDEPFIFNAIRKQYNIDTILKILELSINYGFNYQNHIQMLCKLKIEGYSDDELKKMYLFLNKHNLVDLNQNKYNYDFNPLRKYVFIEMLKEVFIEQKLETHALVDEEFIKNILLTIDEFAPVFHIQNDYEFIQRIKEEIMNSRNNNVNFKDTIITRSDILTAIKNDINKLTNKKLELVLLKK